MKILGWWGHKSHPLSKRWREGRAIDTQEREVIKDLIDNNKNLERLTIDILNMALPMPYRWVFQEDWMPSSSSGLGSYMLPWSLCLVTWSKCSFFWNPWASNFLSSDIWNPWAWVFYPSSFFVKLFITLNIKPISIGLIYNVYIVYMDLKWYEYLHVNNFHVFLCII